MAQRDVCHIKDWDLAISPNFFCGVESNVSGHVKRLNDGIEIDFVGIAVGQSKN